MEAEIIVNELALNKKTKEIKEVLNETNKIRYISDTSLVLIKTKINDIEEIYNIRREDEIVDLKNIALEQIQKLESAIMITFESNIDLLKTNAGKEYIDALLKGYKYCIEKGYLDTAKTYLYVISVLSLRGYIDEYVIDEKFIQKAIFDIIESYGKIAIETNSDKSEDVIEFIANIKDEKNWDEKVFKKYKDCILSIRKEALGSAYNETRVVIDWDGMKIATGIDKKITMNQIKKANRRK